LTSSFFLFRFVHSQSKLTGVSGSIQLLIACGFSLQLKIAASMAEELPATPGAEATLFVTMENKAQFEALLQTLPSITAEDNLLLKFNDLLSPVTKWELFLEMEEPKIDDLVSSKPTAAMENQKKKLSWIEWYDGLKESLETVRSVI
jgi:hypothetical protein